MSTQQPTNVNSAPKDQVAETRRVLEEMNEAANRAIDDQVARSTPMTPRK